MAAATSMGHRVCDTAEEGVALRLFQPPASRLRRRDELHESLYVVVLFV